MSEIVVQFWIICIINYLNIWQASGVVNDSAGRVNSTNRNYKIQLIICNMSQLINVSSTFMSNLHCLLYKEIFILATCMIST